MLMIAPVSHTYKTMFIIPHLELDSSMACRTFRSLKLGLIEDIDESSVPSNSIVFARNPAITTEITLDMQEHNPRDLKAPRRSSVVMVDVRPKLEQRLDEDSHGGSEVTDSVDHSRLV